MPEATAICSANSRFASRGMTAQARAMCPTATVETFGTSADATARIVDYTTDGTNSEVKLAIVGRDVSVSLSAVGAHWAMNAAAALLAASRSGMSIEAAAEALSGYAPPAGRGTADVLPLPGGGRFTLVDDAYNANPASMRAALSALASRSGARRLVALGDMLEIGAGETAAHTELAEPMAAAGVALAFLAGPRMAHLATALPAGLQHVAGVKADDLFETVENALKDGDVLLIKGSNASGMGRLADHLRQWSAAADQQVMKDGAIRAAKGQDAL